MLDINDNVRKGKWIQRCELALKSREEIPLLVQRKK